MPSVTQLSSGIRVLWNGSIMLKCSGAGAGALVSQSVEPSVGAGVGLPQASALPLAASCAGAAVLPQASAPLWAAAWFPASWVAASVSHGLVVCLLIGCPLAI